MKDPSIIWRRTFPECEPGTDGVALFEGRASRWLAAVALRPDLPRLFKM